MILDIMLPDMSGTDVLRQVRQQSRLPVIMLTAKGDNIDRVIGLEMGPMTICPSRVIPVSWWRACVPYCVGLRSMRLCRIKRDAAMGRVNTQCGQPRDGMAGESL